MKTNSITADSVSVAGSGRQDFADPTEEIEEDAVEVAMGRTWRGLPLAWSPSARLAAFRYGMVMMGITEEDKYPNGTYAGMTDDMVAIVMCSLCAEDAGGYPDCPEDVKGMLIRRTLRFNQQKLGECIMRFVEAFEIDPMEEDIYEMGLELLAEEQETEPQPRAKGGSLGKGKEGIPQAT